MSDDLYELPEGWAWAKLGEIVSPLKGKKPAAQSLDPLPGHVPYVTIDTFETGRPKLFTNDLNVPRCDPDDVLLVWDGARAGLSGRGASGVIGSTIVALRSKGIDSRYLFRFLQSRYGEFNSRVRGTGTPHLDPTIVWPTPIPVPPVAEQGRIVAKIEALFEQGSTARAALDRISPLLKKFRQSVLAAAFRGDLTRDWREQHPDVEAASVLLERIRVERRRKWEEDLRAKGKDPRKAKYEEPRPADTSELPELPDGWIWTSVDALISDARYGTSQKCVPKPKGVSVLRIPNVVSGRVNLADLKFADISDRDLARLVVRLNDLLVVRTNGSLDLVGRAALVSELPRPFAFASYLIRLRPLLGSTLARYLDLVFRSDLARGPIELKARSTAGQFNLNLETLRSITVPLPPKDEMGTLVEIVAAVMEQADVIEAAVVAARRRADKLEQSILARAFRGELLPQDPNDEPAPALLDRIRANQGSNAHSKRARVSGSRQSAVRKRGVGAH